MIESEISKDKPYLLNDDFTVTQTAYEIADEDLVINCTTTKQITGAIAMIKEWKYAKSFTSNTITFANSDFEVGVNEISVIDVNYSDGSYGRFTGVIRVTKNTSDPIPPPPVVDNPPTISNNIINQNGYINDAFTVTYNASDDRGITKHEFYDNSNWITKSPSKNGDNYTFTHTFKNIGEKQCKVRVTDSKNQSASSNIFTISVKNLPAVNNPPTISGIVVTDEDFNGNYTLNWTSIDKDNDNLVHRLKIDSNNYITISPIKSGDTYRYKGNSLDVGNHTCYIEVSDESQSVVSKAFNIVIPQKPASLKIELKQAKDNYDLKHANLVEVITNIISDGRFDGDTEKVLLDSAISNYNSSYIKYHEVANRAIDSINDKKVNDAKTEFSKEVEDLNNALGDLEGTMNDAFKQGVLSDAEKISIKQGLKNIENEKSDVDAKYRSLYENPDLIGEAKENLKSSYDTYILKYNNLVNIVNNIINKDGIIDSLDKEKWNAALDAYRTSSADFNEKGNDAINSISKKQATDAEENAKKFTEGKIEILNDSIKSKVSQTEYNNNNKKISEKFTEIKQTTDDITLEVGKKLNSNELSSRIQQSVSDIQIGFNGINDRININPRSMDFTSEQGSRDMSLYGGQLCAFNSSTNQFLSTTGAIIADGYHINGAGFLLSKHCNHFLIGKDNTWDDIFTNRAPRPTHYFDIDFDKYQIKIGLPMLTGDINMRGGSLNDAHVGYIKDWFGFGWRQFETGQQLMYAEGNIIKVPEVVPLKCYGGLYAHGNFYSDTFYFNNGHLAFCKSVGTENVVSNGSHWDFNGMDLVNARIVRSSMGLEVVNNPTARTYGEKKSIFDEIEVIEPVARSFDSIGTLDVSNVSDKASIMLDKDNAEQSKLITLLFKKVKEQDKRIEELEKLVNQLLKTQ